MALAGSAPQRFRFSISQATRLMKPKWLETAAIFERVVKLEAG
jgi:hypothetical protein